MRKKKQIEISKHPDHTEELHRLRKIVGQLEGIEKMIVQRRYCVEIIQQIRAANSAVKAFEIAILKKHLSSCIKKSAKSRSDFSHKLTELLDLIK